nr:diguanylate cyclase [Caldimonas mangrovi]
MVQQRSSPESFLARHVQLQVKLDALRRADSEWTVQILGVQAGLAGNYDPLSHAADAMTAAQFAAAADALALGVPAGTSALAQLHAAVEIKAQAAERMKSERAILANSQRFLPTLVDQIATELRQRRRRAGQNDDAQAALDAVNVVARAMLRSVSHPENSAQFRLDEALVDLRQVRTRRGALRDLADRFELLDVHAFAVLQHRERLRLASRTALNAPVMAAVDAIEAEVDGMLRDRLAQARRYRAHLFVLATLLCAVSVYAVAGWWRSYRALGAANAGLERQLEETRRLMHHAAELQDEAARDPLTGLANRRVVEDRLEHALHLAERHATALAVLFVDLDGFKAVNDRHGHATGDLLLVDVARRLRGQVRDADTVARLGGDEFVLILESTDEAGAKRVADAIIAELRSIDHIESHPVAIGASVGVVTWRPQAGAVPAATLLRRADAAMYEAKRAGKARYALAVLDDAQA